MSEIWLRPNHRVLSAAFIPVLAMGVTGVVLLVRPVPVPLFWLGIVMVLVAAGLAAGLVQQWLRPRVAYNNGHVQFYLRSRQPISVPLQVVEAFFLGQGPSQLPEFDSVETQSVNLVARLSRKHPEWAQREVKKALGDWCDGYITIRGTWCEALSEDVVRRLNRALATASRADLEKGEPVA